MMLFIFSKVNGQSMLGASHVEAVRALRNTGDRLSLLVCDGYDAEAASNHFSSVIANPLVTSDMSKTQFQTSSESLSSIDRENSIDVSRVITMILSLRNWENTYRCMSSLANKLNPNSNPNRITNFARHRGQLT